MKRNTNKQTHRQKDHTLPPTSAVGHFPACRVRHTNWRGLATICCQQGLRDWGEGSMRPQEAVLFSCIDAGRCVGYPPDLVAGRVDVKASASLLRTKSIT